MGAQRDARIFLHGTTAVEPSSSMGGDSGVRGGSLPRGTRPATRASRPAGTGTSFAISDLVIQARYRWQIAPMSDLFVVYNRGGGLPGATTGSSFGDLFNDTLAAPEREGFAVKLRYRFGL